jgi:hypothetical protein
VKVNFKDAASALRWGAPSFEEQQAILAISRGDLGQADAILDQIIAQHPERIENINMYRESGVATALMLKYIQRVSTIPHTSQAETSNLDSSATYRTLPPPAYEEGSVISRPPIAGRNYMCNKDSQSKDAATLSSPINGEDENGLRRRKNN